MGLRVGYLCEGTLCVAFIPEKGELPAPSCSFPLA